MLWSPFLHIYQPPIQKPAILQQIVTECYRPLVAALLAQSTAKATVNINGVLAEMLDQGGFNDVLEGLRTLSERGQVELTASAKYHPFLPILPEVEILRQIKLNTETNRHYFGESYQPKGFFSPEMIFTPEIANVVRSLGYEWMIIDETSRPADADNRPIYQLENGLKLAVRDFPTSLAVIEADTSANLIESHFSGPDEEIVITAMDGEIFGHHRHGHIELLMDVYRAGTVTSLTLSELVECVTEHPVITPKPSSWDTIDRQHSEPFSRWHDVSNQVHTHQVQLLDLAIATVHKEVERNGEDGPARLLLDAGLHSCQFWWASATPWWSLEMIEQGAHQLLSAIQACESATSETKQQSQELYYKIITTGFEWQRTGHVDERGQGDYK